MRLAVPPLFDTTWSPTRVHTNLRYIKKGMTPRWSLLHTPLCTHHSGFYGIEILYSSKLTFLLFSSPSKTTMKLLTVLTLVSLAPYTFALSQQEADCKAQYCTKIWDIDVQCMNDNPTDYPKALKCACDTIQEEDYFK